MFKLFTNVLLITVAVCFPVSYAIAKTGMVFDINMVQPKGECYEVNVPDTLDLAERAHLTVNGVIGVMDPHQYYDQYQNAYFNVNPPYMAHHLFGACNQGKLAQGLLTARIMCGSQKDINIDRDMLQGTLRLIKEDGLFYADAKDNVWHIDSEVLVPVNTARMLISFILLYQQSPNPELKNLIIKMADGICQRAKYEEEYAYFGFVPAGALDTAIGALGPWEVIFVHGGSLRALCWAYSFTGDKKYLELAGKLKNLLLQKRYWNPENAPKAIEPSEHAQFMGHHHSYCTALMGLLAYANVTNDANLKRFVRSGYEYLRNFGLARIGLFGESCTTADMTYLAIKLTDAGVGDYWEDADQYIRNQLTELQITDSTKLRTAVEQMPSDSPYGRAPHDPYKKPLDPNQETTDRVIERNVGAYLSDGIHPTVIPQQSFMWTICCTGNCPPALYAVWESTVRYANGMARVNLLLNRASPWLDVDSYLPFEGKVVIRNKQAKNVSVRIPLWVNKNDVISLINGEKTDCVWTGQYLLLAGLGSNDVITITFPVVETTEKYTLRWKETDFWMESTNPGQSWVPGSTVYTMRFRGNTLVDISPRSQSVGYPLYQRDSLKGNKAKMKKVTRFISSSIAGW